MQRINSVDGLFHEGNPAIGQKGTKVTSVFFNDIQEEVIALGGNILSSDIEVTLEEIHGICFANPPEGDSVQYHLPDYDTVGPLKRFKIKNIGQGEAQLDAVDGKTIDGEATLSLAPGDRFELVKDGANWQTI
jgi:hypothetical protein